MEIKNVRYSPEAWTEVCLLRRRLELLRILHAKVFRECPALEWQLKILYSDVFMSPDAFGRKLIALL
jgi:hypothetical protein